MCTLEVACEGLIKGLADEPLCALCSTCKSLSSCCPCACRLFTKCGLATNRLRCLHHFSSSDPKQRSPMASSLELSPFDADMLRDIKTDLLQGSDATEGFDFDLDHLPPLHSSSGASVEVSHPPPSPPYVS